MPAKSPEANRRDVRRCVERKRLGIAAYKQDHGCAACGYDRCAGALHLHHRDPADKSFSISGSLTKSRDDLFDEIEKCDVLCANCHAEHHESLRDPSDTV